MTRPPRSKLTHQGTYKPEVIELALTVLAVEGSAQRAASVVKDKFGAGPTGATIDGWAKDKHNEQYRRIREDVGAEIKSRVATTVEDELREHLLVVAKARERVDKELPKLEPRDTPGALRNVATSTAILADKLHQMRGDNTIHVEHTLNADELFRSLARVLGNGVAPSVEGTAEEIGPG